MRLNSFGLISFFFVGFYLNDIAERPDLERI